MNHFTMRLRATRQLAPPFRSFLPQAVGAFVAALALTALLMPQSPAAASALTLSIDVQPLFDNIENFLPIFFSILAIAGGIAIAVALAKFIINAVLSGFQGHGV